MIKRKPSRRLKQLNESCPRKNSTINYLIESLLTDDYDNNLGDIEEDLNDPFNLTGYPQAMEMIYDDNVKSKYENHHKKDPNVVREKEEILEFWDFDEVIKNENATQSEHFNTHHFMIMSRKSDGKKFKFVMSFKPSGWLDNVYM